MNKLELKSLRALAKRWSKEANKLSAKSRKTWEKLGSEELPQEDAIIYSVYEDEASARRPQRLCPGPE